MKLKTNIDSVEAQIQDNKLVLKSKIPLKILSSAVLNGGPREANCIVNVQVDESAGSDVDDEVHRDAKDFLLDETTKSGIPKDNVVALMTAARMKNVEVITEKFQDLTVTTFVTAGAYFAATPGDEVSSKQVAFPPKKWGTINTIMVVDANLTDSCMVNAIVSATEAKAAALRELDLRSRFSAEAATGTVTDGIVIACTKREKPIKYAGSGTVIGELIGKSVKAALKSAIFKQENMYSNRPLTRRLEERGITVENLTILFSQIRPVLRNYPEKREVFIKEFKQTLADPNVATLVIAGLRLDEDVKNNLIPKTTDNKETDDFVLHKILQKAVTDYLTKEQTEFKFIRPDYLSSTFSENMGWFTRSVLSAVMHCVYLRVEKNQKD
jgi:iron complex transport system ATP-binding protein